MPLVLPLSWKARLRERDFDVVEREGGHEVVYRPLGVRTQFSGPEHEVVYRETAPVLGPRELRRIKIAVSFTPTDQGGRAARYELIGPSDATGRFGVGAAPDELRTHRQADFSVLDRDSGVRLHYAADGSLVARDQPLADGRGHVRLDMVQPSTAPQFLDPSGTPSAALRVEPLGARQVALIPHATTDDPREPIIVDTETGSLTEGTATTPADSAETRSARTDQSQGTARRGDDLRDEGDAAATRDAAKNTPESGMRRAAADAAREESDTTGSTAESLAGGSLAGGSASFPDAEVAARAARVPADGRALIEEQRPVDTPTAFDRVVTGDAGGPLDIVQAERLSADAREEAVRRGADPAVLHAGAVALRNAAYEALVNDARYAVQEFVRSPGQGRIDDQGFTVTPRPDDGHAVAHESGLRMEFDAGQRWTSREFLLADAPASMGNMTVVVGRTRDDGGREVLSYRLAGDSRWVARFDVTPIADDSPDAPFGPFMATDALTGDRYLFGGDGTHTVHDVPQRDGWAYVRRDVARWVGNRGWWTPTAGRGTAGGSRR